MRKVNKVPKPDSMKCIKYHPVLNGGGLDRVSNDEAHNYVIRGLATYTTKKEWKMWKLGEGE